MKAISKNVLRKFRVNVWSHRKSPMVSSRWCFLYSLGSNRIGIENTYDQGLSNELPNIFSQYLLSFKCGLKALCFMRFFGSSSDSSVRCENKLDKIDRVAYINKIYWLNHLFRRVFAVLALVQSNRMNEKEFQKFSVFRPFSIVLTL